MEHLHHCLLPICWFQTDLLDPFVQIWKKKKLKHSLINHIKYPAISKCKKNNPD